MRKSAIYLIILALILGLAISINIYRGRKASFGPKDIRKEAATTKTAKIKGEFDIQNVFIDVADKTGKAIVAISTERTQKIGLRSSPAPYRRFRSPYDSEDPLERFFEEFFGQLPEKEFKQKGLGSGFIIDKEGYILTNNHVVEGADKINITLPDGRSFVGAIKGADPRSDIAVIKIDAKDLPVVELGDSNLVQIGEWVVALGNPFGHIIRNPEPTVTVGVISALHRRIPTPAGEGGYLDMIQTDAAINPGNSGGPLCDLNGNVIGMNVAIFSTSGGYQGIGFAIPVNAVKDILDDLIEGKEITYGWLGVTAQEITPEIAEYFNLPDKKGALIADVMPDSPAEKSGLKEGDIVKSIGGKPVASIDDLVKEVGAKKADEAVSVDIIRDRIKKRINVTIGKRPSMAELAGKKDFGALEIMEKWRGIEVADITNEIARDLDLQNREGVVIVNIDSASPSFEAGLRKGDVIRELNRAGVKNASDYKKIIRETKGLALVRTDRGYFTVKEDGKG